MGQLKAIDGCCPLNLNNSSANSFSSGKVEKYTVNTYAVWSGWLHVLELTHRNQSRSVKPREAHPINWESKKYRLVQPDTNNRLQLALMTGSKKSSIISDLPAPLSVLKLNRFWISLMSSRSTITKSLLWSIISIRALQWRIGAIIFHAFFLRNVEKLSYNQQAWINWGWILWLRTSFVSYNLKIVPRTMHYRKVYICAQTWWLASQPLVYSSWVQYYRSSESVWWHHGYDQTASGFGSLLCPSSDVSSVCRPVSRSDHTVSTLPSTIYATPHTPSEFQSYPLYQTI